MTNYDKYPSWRDTYGIIIEFFPTKEEIERHAKEYELAKGFMDKEAPKHYSWCDNNKANRDYLCKSDYLDGASRIYVCNIKHWFSIDEFKQACKANLIGNRDIWLNRDKK